MPAATGPTTSVQRLGRKVTKKPTKSVKQVAAPTRATKKHQGEYDPKITAALPKYFATHEVPTTRSEWEDVVAALCEMFPEFNRDAASVEEHWHNHANPAIVLSKTLPFMAHELKELKKRSKGYGGWAKLLRKINEKNHATPAYLQQLREHNSSSFPVRTKNDFVQYEKAAAKAPAKEAKKAHLIDLAPAAVAIHSLKRHAEDAETTDANKKLKTELAPGFTDVEDLEAPLVGHVVVHAAAAEGPETAWPVPSEAVVTAGLLADINDADEISLDSPIFMDVPVESEPLMEASPPAAHVQAAVAEGVFDFAALDGVKHVLDTETGLMTKVT